jgi:hypothetical protein
MRSERGNRGAWIAGLVGSIVLTAGCAKPAGFESPALAMTMADMAGAAAGPARDGGFLAYEHGVSLEMSKQLLPARLREVEAACHADRASACTILQVSAHSNQDVPSGTIRMRLARAGVDPIVALASKNAKVLSRTTQAEDLEQPVTDTERELTLMTLHRDRLMEFMKSKDIKIEQLITVSKELATVQAQIASLNSQHANLRRRIDTELLTINMSVPFVLQQSAQTPVRDALRSFGIDFSEAAATVIGFVAAALPWLAVALPGLVLLRLFWRWVTRWIVRREQRSAAGRG